MSPVPPDARSRLPAFDRRAPGGLFVPHTRLLPNNPYDGHTLRDGIDRTEALTGCPIERAYVDKGYRGHDTQNPLCVFISGSAACSAPSSASCGAVPPSSPSRTFEGRRSPWPLPPQTRRRRRQRRALSSRPQLPPYPRLALRTLVAIPDPAMAYACLPTPAQ